MVEWEKEIFTKTIYLRETQKIFFYSDINRMGGKYGVIRVEKQKYMGVRRENMEKERI